ncbi:MULTISPECIES: LuxR C-terminal-related transcriptional regulator [unclassified Acidovorax]|uniref:response regulator transcription factor n=1 Tax=unclassified Acidovorax TaxID=2684926 RepID=UPI0038578E62
MSEFLRLHPGLDDAVCVCTTQEALRTIAAQGAPALALVDFWLADGTTTHFIRDLLALAPQVRVLMVSGDSHPAILLKAQGSGAHGFVHKQHSPEVFAAAATALLQGGTWFETLPPIDDAPLQSHAIPLAPTDLGLTPRQGQILAHVLEGQPNKHIAGALNLSEHTVKEHVTAILGKLGVRNRVEAIARLRGVRLETGDDPRLR